MKARLLIQLIGLCIFITLFSCSNTMQLTYTKPPAAPSIKGQIYVSIDDLRPPDRGGKDPLKVGFVRNAFGQPFPVKAAPDREPSKVVKELISVCLMSAGYKVVDDSSAAPHLRAQLKVFWSDGYQHSRMGLRMPIELRKSKKSIGVWAYELDVNTGFTVRSAGYKQFNSGYNKMLEVAKEKLVEQFKRTEFQSHYLALQ